MKTSTLAILFCILIAGATSFLFLSPSHQGKPLATSNIVADTVTVQSQKVVIGMKNLNYFPNTITVKAGKPVSITLDSSVQGCLRSFNIRDLGVSGFARTPDQTIDFTPQQKGTYTFTCAMGMGRGTLVVE